MPMDFIARPQYLNDMVKRWHGDAMRAAIAHELELILDDPATLTVETEADAARLAQLLQNGSENLAGIYPESEDRRHIFLCLQELTARHPNSAEVRRLAADAGCGLVVHGGSIEGRHALNWLKALYDVYSDEAGVRAAAARAAHSFMEVEYPDDQQALLDWMKALQSRHPEDTVVRHELVQAVLDEVHGCYEGDEEGYENFAWLKSIQTRYSDDAGIRRAVASGAAWLINQEGEENRLKKAYRLFDELKAFQARYPEDACVREELARAASDLVLTEAYGERPGKARAMLIWLKAFQSLYPEDEGVRTWAISGTHALFQYALNKVDANEAMALWHYVTSFGPIPVPPSDSEILAEMRDALVGKGWLKP